MRRLTQLMSSMRDALKHRFNRWLTRRLPPSLKKTLDNRSIFIFPTRLGFTYLFVMLLVFLLGTNYQNNVIILFAYLQASLFITAMLQSYFNFKGLSITGVEKVTGFVNQETHVLFTLLSNQTRHALNIQYVKQPLTHVEYLDKEQSISVTYQASQRGECYLGRVNINSEHVLGLFKTWTWCDFGTKAVFYPEAKPIAIRALDKKHKAVNIEHDRSSAILLAGNDDFQDLSRYRQGESLSQIAWKQFARGQGKLTKKYGQPVSKDVWLMIDDMPTKEIELKLSYLCYLVKQYTHENISFGLELNTLSIAPNTGHEHMLSCLYALATYGFTQGSD